jgi:hypothetical protein
MYQIVLLSNRTQQETINHPMVFLLLIQKCGHFSQHGKSMLLATASITPASFTSAPVSNVTKI